MKIDEKKKPEEFKTVTDLSKKQQEKKTPQKPKVEKSSVEVTKKAGSKPKAALKKAD